jgi:hypothetical protein
MAVFHVLTIGRASTRTSATAAEGDKYVLERRKSPAV